MKFKAEASNQRKLYFIAKSNGIWFALSKSTIGKFPITCILQTPYQKSSNLRDASDVHRPKIVCLKTNEIFSIEVGNFFSFSLQNPLQSQCPFQIFACL